MSPSMMQANGCFLVPSGPSHLAPLCVKVLPSMTVSPIV